MKNETKPTPGPWLVANHPMGALVYCLYNKGYMTCQCHAPEVAEAQANAALIAAAPELLEAAKKALDCIKGFDTAFADGDGDKLEEVRLLEAAIAKAEGKS